VIFGLNKNAIAIFASGCFAAYGVDFLFQGEWIGAGLNLTISLVASMFADMEYKTAPTATATNDVSERLS
jgi:hypothetical protein